MKLKRLSRLQKIIIVITCFIALCFRISNSLEQCNLKAISTLKSLDKDIKIGWSDHSKNPDVLYRTINHWNAQIIEFHLDLDGEGGEYSSGHFGCQMK